MKYEVFIVCVYVCICCEFGHPALLIASGFCRFVSSFRFSFSLDEAFRSSRIRFLSFCQTLSFPCKLHLCNALIIARRLFASVFLCWRSCVKARLFARFCNLQLCNLQLARFCKARDRNVQKKPNKSKRLHFHTSHKPSA